MNIEELNKIVSHMNLSQIHAMLEKHGFRRASKNGVWEFEPIAIANANKVENSKRYEDIFDDKVYVGDIHTEVQQYHNIEFIVITVNKIYRNKANIEQPIIMELYTDAPVSEEYESKQLKIEKCAICKKNFFISELCEINGKLVCDKCFEKDLIVLIKNGRSKLVKKHKGEK